MRYSQSFHREVIQCNTMYIINIRLLGAVSSPAQIGKDPWFEPIHAGGLLLQYGAQTAELEWYALGEMKCATSTGPRLTIQ